MNRMLNHIYDRMLFVETRIINGKRITDYSLTQRYRNSIFYLSSIAVENRLEIDRHYYLTTFCNESSRIKTMWCDIEERLKFI